MSEDILTQMINPHRNPDIKSMALMIGNTDNKLTQQEWADFVDDFVRKVRSSCTNVHFTGAPPTNSPFQNYCMVISMDGTNSSYNLLMQELTEIREKYRQNSVAVLEGKTRFI